jgi:hypothetical protein
LNNCFLKTGPDHSRNDQFPFQWTSLGNQLDFPFATTWFIGRTLFIGDFPVGAILRAGNAGPAAGTIEALKRIVKILRQAYPRVQIELRADAGFSEPDIYEYCERNKIKYLIGLPGNSRLTAKTEHIAGIAKQKFRDEYLKEEPEGCASDRTRGGSLSMKVV